MQKNETNLELLVASMNKKKLIELEAFLKGLPVKLRSLSEFPDVREVPEDGKSFEENASLKALGYAKQTNLMTLAEDSGICCDALDGAPGIYSARFAGPAKSDHENNLKLLRLLDKIPDNCRGAHYKSAIAFASTEQVIHVVTGEVHGAISKEFRGEGGFGYDVLFFYPPFQKNFAEVSLEMKAKVSHRTKSLEKFRNFLEEYLKKQACEKS